MVQNSLPPSLEMDVAVPTVQMRNIVKLFPQVTANDGIDFDANRGEIHGLLGENGAGKSTLMSILFGLYKPDHGDILIDGTAVRFDSPRDAIRAGIGMVHQHFTLIPVFTVMENLVLGNEPRRGLMLDTKKALEETEQLSKRYGLEVDPLAPVGKISVSQQQRVEILKALRRGAKIMILDEPTSVLVPQEAEYLFSVLLRLRDEGHTIIFISHKLKESLSITDRITVLRDGKVVGTVQTKSTNATELACMMVGREVLSNVKKPFQNPGNPVLRVNNLSAADNRGLPTLRSVSFEVAEGEIVGIAAIEGNGQGELVEVLTGLRRSSGGTVHLAGEDVTGCSPAQLHRDGLAYIPEDRHRRGLVLEASVADNAVLGFQDDPYYTWGPLLLVARIAKFGLRLIKDFGVRATSTDALVKTLSGGNQQRLIVGRELSRSPKLLIAAQPTWGLDIGASEFVHQQLIKQRGAGVGIVLRSSDLSEVISLSDRILVIFEGRIVRACRATEITEQELGFLMAGGKAPDNGRS